MVRSLIYFNERPDNLGDVIIYERLAMLLLDKGHEVYVFGMPLRSQGRVVQVLGRFRVNWLIINSILSKDKLLLFSSPGGPVFEREFKFNFGHVLLSIYKTLGVRKVFSFSSITSTLEVSKLSRVISQYDYLLLRDRGSQAYYSSMYLSGKSLLVSDISFYKKQVILRQYKDDLSVGFSFRSSTPEKGQSSVLDLESKFFSSIVNKKFFCQVVEDWEFMRKFGKHVHFLTPENYESYYSNLDVVITNRVHVYLFALQNGCTPVMLTHKNHRKAIDLIKDLGLDDTIIFSDSDGLDENLLDKIYSLRDLVNNANYPSDNLFISSVDLIV